MMYRALYDDIKRIFTANINDEELATFMATSIDEQVAVVVDLLNANPSLYNKGAGELHAKCYVVIMHLELGTLLPNADLHQVKDYLKIPVVSKWTKANPPQSDFELFSTTRQPLWTEEVAKMGAAAQLLSFGDISEYYDIVAAVKTSLGIGGMEDIEDDRAMSYNDVTLELAVRFVLYSLKTARPEWCTPEGILLKELPAGVDGRPLYVLKAEVDEVDKKRREEVRKKSLNERRAKLQVDYEARKKIVFDALKGFDLGTLVFDCSEMEFEKFRDMTEVPWKKPEFVNAISALIPVDKVPEDKEAADAMIAEKLHFVEQFVLTAIQGAKPSWFKTLANGDLSVRRGIGGADAPGLTREAKAVQGNLNKLIERYGVPELINAMLALSGCKKTAAEIFAGSVWDTPEQK